MAPPAPVVALLIDGASFGEWALVAVVALIVFGPRRLPELARKIGRVMAQVRHAADLFRDQLMALDQDEVPLPPVRDEPHADLAPPPDPPSAPDEVTASEPGDRT